MLNLYSYLCADPDMDLSPIRAKSERLYRDILRERQFYAEHPECDNVHFFHKVKQGSQTSYWLDRWGIVMLSLSNKRWLARVCRSHTSPAVRKKHWLQYYYVGLHFGGRMEFPYIHSLMADVFLPNTDFTKCQIDHLNSDQFDNNALNLERVTPEENIRRREVAHCHKKGKPVPWKYQTPENYLQYLQKLKTIKT